MLKNIILSIILLTPFIWIIPHGLAKEERRVEIACQHNKKLGYPVKCKGD